MSLRLALAIAASIAFACGPAPVPQGPSRNQPGGAADEQSGRGHECTENQDCGSQRGCYEGTCVEVVPGEQTFSIQVTPPPSAGLLAEQYQGVQPGDRGEVLLTLTEPIEVRGVVVFGSPGSKDKHQEAYGGWGSAPAKTEMLAGRLVAVADGLVPGTELRSQTVVVPPENGEPEGMGEVTSFVLRLTAGLPYRVTFLPDERPFDPELPWLPPYFVDARFQKGGRFDLVLPPREAYMQSTVVGVVVLDEAGTIPVAGAVVSSSSQGMKASTTTTMQDGTFRLVLQPGEGPVVIRIEPGEGSELFPVRQFEYQTSQAVLGMPGTNRFVVGPVPPQRTIELQVVGELHGQTGPVPSAWVHASGQAGQGTFEATGVTDKNGVVKLALLEGVYVLSVVPESGSPLAATQSLLDLTKVEANTFKIVVPPRVLVTGRVVLVHENREQPVAGARVEFSTDRLESLSREAAGQVQLVQVAVTNQSGNFQSYLDKGRYAVTVTPGPGVNVARFSQPELLVEGPAELTIRLPEARLLSGRVMSAIDGGPVAGAKVDVFFVPKDPSTYQVWSLGETGFARSVLLAASSLTDESGHFATLVPLIQSSEQGANSGGSGEAGGPPGVGGENSTTENDSGGLGFGLEPIEVHPRQGAEH